MSSSDVPRFGRRFLSGEETFTLIGSGALGGKADGLDQVRRQILPAIDSARFAPISVGIPHTVVVGTDVFDEFMENSGLLDLALSGAEDDRIALAFQKAAIPPRYVGDLRSLITGVHSPLAIRSSSLLEDALAHPFAGVYSTKMIPNNQADVDTRFQKLMAAMKYVWSSTYFAAARNYAASIGQDIRSEKMALIIQEIVGERHRDRFYPTLSGVARSFNYYPMGRSAPTDGVVNLALGLGRQIVDGGLSWNYSPLHPAAPPPFATPGERMSNTQRGFWAVHMGRPPLPDPIRETEYLVEADLDDAESDGILAPLVSTYDPRSERFRMGAAQKGTRVLDFAPILQTGSPPLNDLVRDLLSVSENQAGQAVEIEFAMSHLGGGTSTPRFGFLQLRPMAVNFQEIELSDDEMRSTRALLTSTQVLGNGVREDITDIVFVDPERFDAGQTPAIALELEAVNRTLSEENRNYLLIGFGRWGSADPWLGIPVSWGQISHARVIVEASLPDMSPDLSQGSHFFHNLIGLEILYLSIGRGSESVVDWDWLRTRPVVSRDRWVTHVRTERPLEVKVDGMHSRGIVLRDE